MKEFGVGDGTVTDDIAGDVSRFMDEADSDGDGELNFEVICELLEVHSL